MFVKPSANKDIEKNDAEKGAKGVWKPKGPFICTKKLE
jgi:hypothetical protein